jgi:phosphoribosylamine--glycine ligase
MNILPILETSFLDLCKAVVGGTLTHDMARFSNKATVCKYVVPKGYGVKSLVGEKVVIDEESIQNSGARLFYASVNEIEGEIFTTSSRSMTVVGIENSINEAEGIAEKALSHVKGNVFMRHDIGKKDLIEKRIKHMKEVRGTDN